MNVLVALFTAWILVTVVWIVLILYRSRITKSETDWIPLSDDAKETQAIEAQKVTEKKGHKLDSPIRALGWASAILLVAVVGYWLYRGLMNPPPMG